MSTSVNVEEAASASPRLGALWMACSRRWRSWSMAERAASAWARTCAALACS
jgi:hypothetical protein